MRLFGKKKKTEEEILQEKLEKENELNDELISLNNKYEKYIDLLHFSGDELFVFKGFYIKDGEIIIQFITPTTPEGFYSNMKYYWFKSKYGMNPLQTRLEFLELQKKFKELGFEIKKMG